MKRVGRVVLWLRAVCGGEVLVMRELIQGLNFEWSWSYEHVRTGVGFGLNVLGGGWQLSEAKQRQLVCELLHDSNSEGQYLQVHSWINIEPTSNYFYTVLSNNLFIF